MPMYDYECSQGHRTEHFLPKFAERVQCGEDGCPLEGEHRPAFWYSSQVPRFAQSFSPVVIHRDASGNVRFPGAADAPVPQGFKKVELSTMHDIRKFENEMNKRDNVKSEKFREARGKFLDGQLAANRKAVDEIAAGGSWQGTDGRGNIIERKGISPRGMKILDQLRAASKHKQEQGRAGARPEFFVEAFTNNASNREDHRDASTNWNRVRK